MVLARMMHGWEHDLSARMPAKAYGQGVLMARPLVRGAWRPTPQQRPYHPCAHIMPTNTYPTQAQLQVHVHTLAYMPTPRARMLATKPFHRLASMKNQDPWRLTRTPLARHRTPSHPLHAPRARSPAHAPAHSRRTPSDTPVRSPRTPSHPAMCHGHACPGLVAHGRMPMTSQTLVMSFHSSVFPFVILERMTPQKYHV